MIVVAAGGDPGAPFVLAPLVAGSVLVAADSGVDRLAQLGLVPHHVVGDLDSADPAVVAAARRAGAVVHHHEPDKDATDLELALRLVADELVAASGLDHVLVVGGGGGRLDHLVADVALLAAPWLAPMEVTARLGTATITVVRPQRPRRVHREAGDQVSLLAIGGPATGVSTIGLRWPLVEGDLDVGSTRAMSNQVVGADAAVSVRSGVVVAIQPGSPAADVASRRGPYDPSPRLQGDGP
jgi:thiamine pyrophosphokinase